MNQKTRCIFYYDFGDNWKFNVKILDGENLGILEDCGGVCGLEHIVKLLKNAYETWHL